MTTAIETLDAQLHDDLNALLTNEPHSLRRTYQCIQLCRQAMKVIHRHIEKKTFTTTTEEIQFFKEIYPVFYAEYCYYVQLYQVETHRPAGSRVAQIQYLQTHLDRIQYFFDNHPDFYQYYRTGGKHLDEMYFTRSCDNPALFPDDMAIILDLSCCTLHSYKLAVIFAHERLQLYLNQAITEKEQVSFAGDKSEQKNSGLQWTGPKAALIELIYGLQGAGVFNHSATDIKQIAGYFEHMFSVKLGNVYNVFQEMRIRKKNRSSFLDLLKDRLIQRMDEADEGY